MELFLGIAMSDWGRTVKKSLRSHPTFLGFFSTSEGSEILLKVLQPPLILLKAVSGKTEGIAKNGEPKRKKNHEYKCQQIDSAGTPRSHH